MFCFQCGKEISDGSKFCYSCGTKIEEKAETKAITDELAETVNLKKTNDLNSKQQEAYISETSVKVSNIKTSSDKEDRKKKYGYGWIGLILVYGLFMSNWIKNYDPTTYSNITLFLVLSSLPIILVIYFIIRKILLKRTYFTNKVSLSSFISGFLSFILVMAITGASIGWDNGIQKRKEIDEIMMNYKKQIEIIKQQEIEYKKMMSFEPKTILEINNKLSKIDEYKIFLENKNKIFINLTSSFRKTNLKYKKDKSVDEQINKLEKLIDDVLKITIGGLDISKKYYITGDEKYYVLVQQVSEKQQSYGDEINKLFANIISNL